MKHAFLIAGFNLQRTASHKNYTELRSAITAKGYRVIPIDISWRQTTPSKYAAKFEEIYRANKSPEGNIVIGNSFGAVVGLITAPKLKPDMILLCSLSPFFEEDWGGDWPKAEHYQRLGKRRITDIKQYSAKSLAQVLQSQETDVKILYGELEKGPLPVPVARSQDLARQIPKAALIEVPNAPHRFRMPPYVKGIQKEL